MFSFVRLSSLRAFAATAASTLLSTALAAASAGPITISTQPGNPLALDLSTTAGPESGTTYTWYFGDGTSATGHAASHVYAYPGRYLLTLEADDGNGVQTTTAWATAGHQREYSSFDQGLPPVEEWQMIDVVVTPDASIVGAGGVLLDIVHPNPKSSCGTPPRTPPNGPPREDEPPRWLLSTLIDLGSAPALEGSSLEILRVTDDTASDPLFGVRLAYTNATWTIAAFADELGSQADPLWTPVRDLGADELLVELAYQLDEPSLPNGGSLRLRVVDHSNGQELVTDLLQSLDNGHLEPSSFDFGFLDPSFPGAGSGATGEIHLDEWRVLTNLCLPPSTADLLGHWDFESALEPGTDSSSGARHGTLVGGATLTPGRIVGTPGLLETALSLDGTGYLQIPSLGAHLNEAPAATVEAWVKVDAHSQTNLFRMQQPLAVRSNGVSVSNFVDGTGWESVYAPSTPPVGIWFHLAAVFDQGQLGLYIDGQKVDEKSLAFSVLQGTIYNDWAIGARIPGAGGADQFFTGAVDDLKVYARALGADEIRAAAGHCGY